MIGFGFHAWHGTAWRGLARRGYLNTPPSAMAEGIKQVKFMKCPICNKGTLKRKVIDEEFEYKGQKITIPNCVVYSCDICAEGLFFNKNTEKRISMILNEFKEEVEKREQQARESTKI